MEYFINDFLVGGLLIALAFCLGNLFDNYVQDPRIRAQIYFHLWNSVNVNFIAFSIHLLISGYNARRVGYHKTYEQFKTEQRQNYKDDLLVRFATEMVTFHSYRTKHWIYDWG